MPRKLSEARIRILERLASRDLDRDGAETQREIAIACGEGRRASDWGACSLREMSYDYPKALVRRVGLGGTGSGSGNAATWTITDAGREVLAQAEAHPASSGGERT